MGFPHTFSDLHIREYGCEGRFFRGAGVYAETDLVGGGIHVADAHLAEIHAVAGALDAVVVGADGSLTGYAGVLERKARLLEIENN